MPGSGLLARDAGSSGLGAQAGMTTKSPHFSARHGRDHLAAGCSVPVLREASHSPAMNKITINFGSPFGALTPTHGIPLAC
jgi:hypothetical protein